MGTELMTVCAKEENDDVPPVPPGFESFSSLITKHVQDGHEGESGSVVRCSASASTSESSPVQKETELGAQEVKITRSLRHRPGINYGRYENSSEDDSDSVKHDQVSSVFLFNLPFSNSFLVL